MMLEVHQIRKSFGDLEVLRQVNLRVNKGDVVAILGPSGSGKTTLLRCLNFLENADGGELDFDGEHVSLGHVSKKDVARLRKKTAFVSPREGRTRSFLQTLSGQIDLAC